MGKDTAVKLIVGHLKSNFPKFRVERRSFATPMKHIAHQMYGWAGLQSEVYYENHPLQKDVVLEKLGKSPRQIWIELGMSGRTIWENTWSKLGITSICPTTELACISDLRFLNEAEQVHAAGGLCIEIINPREPLHTDPADCALDGWTGWNEHIVNDGTVKELGHKLIALLHKREVLPKEMFN